MADVTLDEKQLLAVVMALVQVQEGVVLDSIRKDFMAKDKSWSEADASASTEYRYRNAIKIIERSKA